MQRGCSVVYFSFLGGQLKHIGLQTFPRAYLFLFYIVKDVTRSNLSLIRLLIFPSPPRQSPSSLKVTGGNEAAGPLIHAKVVCFGIDLACLASHDTCSSNVFSSLLVVAG